MSINKDSKLNDYLENICSYIKFKEAHEEIKEELISHLEEIKEEYIEHGFLEEEATSKAIDCMGNPEEIGKQLNIAHKGKPDWLTLILTLFFVNIGVILMYFMKVNGLLFWNENIFNNSIKHALIGTVIAIFLYYFDYRKLKKYSKYIFIGTFIVFLFFPFISVPVNGKPMISIGNYCFNFTAASPYIFIIALAGIFSDWDWNNKKNLLKALFLFLAPIIIIPIEVAYWGIYFIGFIVLAKKSGLNIKYIVSIFGVTIVGFMVLLFSNPFIINRLLFFLNPKANPIGSAYINIQISNIIHSSKMFGNGFSFPKKIFPDIHCEFIFNYIVYTFGWIGAGVLIVLVIIFIMRILRITKQIKDDYGKLLVSGLISIFIVQFLYNILMNVNLMPIIQISLPFISYGGTLFLFNLISVGLILSVYRRRNLSLNHNNNGLKEIKS